MRNENREGLNHAKPEGDLEIQCKTIIYLDFPARSSSQDVSDTLVPETRFLSTTQGEPLTTPGAQAPEAEMWEVKRIVKNWG